MKYPMSAKIEQGTYEWKTQYFYDDLYGIPVNKYNFNLKLSVSCFLTSLTLIFNSKQNRRTSYPRYNLTV